MLLRLNERRPAEPSDNSERPSCAGDKTGQLESKDSAGVFNVFDRSPPYLRIVTSNILITNCYLLEIRRIGRDYKPH